MKYSISYLEKSNILEIICSGPADPQGFMDYSIDISRHPKFGPKARLLFDHRQLEVENLKTGEINQIAEFLKTLTPQMKNIKQAIVGRPDMNLGKARIFQVLIGDLEDKGKIMTRIFTNYEEAVRWLASDTYIELS